MECRLPAIPTHRRVWHERARIRHVQASLFAATVLKRPGMANYYKTTAWMPHCYACRVERVSLAVVPIEKHYDLRWLQCPMCKHVLKLVKPRSSLVVAQSDVARSCTNARPSRLKMR